MTNLTLVDDGRKDKAMTKEQEVFSRQLAVNLKKIVAVLSAQVHAAGLLNYTTLESSLLNATEVVEFQREELEKYIDAHQPSPIIGATNGD